MNLSTSVRRRVPLYVSLVLAGVYGWSLLHAQGLPAPQAPGGFLETATSTAVRPGYTAQDLQTWLPSRGTFTFPAPYNTQGIRLTNASDCGGADCVDYVGYSYWRNMNNSAGSNFLYAFVGLNSNRGGAGPSLFRYDKTTGETVNLGPLFATNDPRGGGSAEGWYFSATQPTTLYVPNWQQLLRYDVLSHAVSVVFNVADQLGQDKYILQVHSSNDDRVHSFTLALTTNFSTLGCATYREDTHQFSVFPAHGFYDECQVDKSGHWLLIKEDVDGKDGVDNRIINLDTGVETVLLDPDGAGGHSDNGFGVMIAADNFNQVPNALRLWAFGTSPLGPGSIVYRDPDWIPESVQHLSFANARSAPLDQQYACGSAANRVIGPRANEVVCFRLDGSMQTLVVAPVMTDLDASGGGADDYSKDPKGNLDPTGQYFMWTSNLMSGRLDAFIVRVPSQVLIPLDPAADLVAPAVSITAPAQAGIVSGDVPLSATATDNVGVAGVQFKLDGVNLGAEILAPPFAWTWHTPSTADGVHTLTAVARDAAGNVTISPSIAVTVLNVPTGPQISAPGTVTLAGTSALISWTTNQLADSWIEYGLTPAYGSATALDPALVRTHLQTIAGLTPNTTYHYRVTSKNAQGTATTSADFTFTTLPAPLITGLALSALAPASVTVSWTTDRAADSSLQYGTSVGYGLTAYGDGSFVTSHTMGLTGLAPGVTYHVRAHSMTPEGVDAASSDLMFTTPFFLVGNVASSAVTSSSAVVSWTTSVGASTQVEYGLTPAYGSVTTLDPSLVTAHSQALVGLIHTLTYHYRVRSTNAQGQLVTSGDLSFTTPDGVLVSNVTVFNIQGAAAAINWTSDQPADAQIEYGLTTGYGTLTTLNTSLVTSHGQAVSAGLVPGTTYHFRVRSRNAAGLLGTSADATFTTAPAAVISGVAVAAVTGTTATITWTTDLATKSQIEYGLSASYGSSTALDSTLVTAHSLTITGLTAGTKYFYLVRATTAQNALTKLGGFTVTTLTVPVISGVTATAVAATSATIGWTTTQAADSQVDYGVTSAYGSTTALDATLVTAHSQGLTGLTPVTTYHYRVRSANGGGQSTSGDFTFATPDAPPVIASVTASALTTSTATITWTTDRPASAVVYYGLTSAYGSLTIDPGGEVTSHSVGLTGLAAGTTYHYRVASGAAGGTTSSGDATFATVEPPPVISNVAVSAIAVTSATVGWTTDRASDSQVEYGLTSTYGSATTLDATLVTAHSQALTGLTAGLTYHYRVKSSNGAVTASADATFTLLAPAPLVSAGLASAIATTSATIGWTTDRAADSQVEFGLTTAYGSTTSLDATPVITHSQSLIALTPGTTYHYRVKSGTSGGLTVSGDATFTTLVPLPVISSLAASALTATSASIGWTTDLASDSQVEYGLTTAYGSVTALDNALVTVHSQPLAGLTLGTTYHYRVKARNAGGQAVSGDAVFTTLSVPPTISAVVASAVASTTATIGWTTDQAADSQVEYGPTTAYGSATALDAALVTTHGQTLTGLVSGTLYHYRVTSKNSAGLPAASADGTFTTTTGVLVSNVTVFNIQGAAVAVNWATDQPADSQIEYGLTIAYGTLTTLNTALVTSHGQAVNTGLVPGTTYHFRIRARNAGGLLGTSADATFTTAPAPVITSVTVAAVTGTTATITWTTDLAAKSQIEYGLSASYGSSTALDPALVTAHSVTITGLTAGTKYFYLVRATTAQNALTKLGGFTVTTLTVPVISGVTATAVAATSATIGWTTTQAADSQVDYGVTSAYGSTTALDATLVTAHSQGLTGLTPVTTYHYRVRSANGGGQSTSGDFTFTTPDTPPVIASVTASALTTSTATITWTTDRPASAVVYYGLTSAYGSLTIDPGGEVTSHSVGLTGLAAGTTYHYRVASGAAGGTTASGDATFATVEPPPVISNVVASAIAVTSATVGWTTDRASDSQVEYGLTSTYGSATTLDATPVTAHGQALTGLAAGALYHYRVLSRAAGGLTASADGTFVTVAPVPVISAVGVLTVTGSSATIGWTTDLPSSSQTDYGPTSAYGSTTSLDAALVTAHSQTITGLAPGMTYFYRVRSVSALNVTAALGGVTFTTIAPPVLSNVAASGVTPAAATISWTTDQTADSQVEYGPTTAYGTIVVDAALVTSHGLAIGALTSGTLYHYRVQSRNGAGLTATSADGTFTTTAPSAAAISNVTVSNIQGAAAAVNWSTDQPADTQIEYGLTTAYGSLTTLNTALVTSHGQAVNSGLVPGTTYHFRIRARNAAGVLGTSADATFTTAPAPVISAVAIAAVTSTSVTITWTTDLASKSQIEYGLSAAYGSSTTLDPTLVTSHSQTITGLTPGTKYSFLIRATTGANALTKVGGFTVTTSAPFQ